MKVPKLPLPDVFGSLDRKQFYVYIQYRPNGTPFYVGKGIDKRYTDDHSYNKHYVAVLNKYGLNQIRTVIYPSNSSKEACQWEQELIYLLRSQGNVLVNKTDGGEGLGGFKHTLETREKQSLAARNRPKWKHTEEAKKLISEASKNRPIYLRTPITIENQSKARKKLVLEGWVSPFKGKKNWFSHTPETRAAMSLKRKGRKHSEAHKQAMKAAQVRLAIRKKMTRIAFRVVSPMLLTA